MQIQKIYWVLYPVLYWILVVLLPLKILPILISNGSIIFNYFLVVPLLLLFIPYKLVDVYTKKQKFYFILFGLVIPLILLYVYLYYEFLVGFNPSF